MVGGETVKIHKVKVFLFESQCELTIFLFSLERRPLFLPNSPIAPVPLRQRPLGARPALLLLAFPSSLATVLPLIRVSQRHLERLEVAWQC